MQKIILIDSWTQLLFYQKQHNSKIYMYSNEKDFKKLSYPREIMIVGNDDEQFIWT